MPAKPQVPYVRNWIGSAFIDASPFAREKNFAVLSGFLLYGPILLVIVLDGFQRLQTLKLL